MIKIADTASMPQFAEARAGMLVIQSSSSAESGKGRTGPERPLRDNDLRVGVQQFCAMLRPFWCQSLELEFLSLQCRAELTIRQAMTESRGARIVRHGTRVQPSLAEKTGPMSMWHRSQIGTADEAPPEFQLASRAHW